MTAARGRKRAHYATAVKPALLPVDFAGVPAAMRAAARWVVWRCEFVEGRWTKVPYRADGRTASSTDPGTWAVFDAAAAAFRRGGFDGVGFVLGEGWVGVDLDDAIDPATGNLHPEAAEIVRRLGSYTELSPSGTGVKAFARGGLPAGCKRRSPTTWGEVEAYDAGRFFCVTGRPLPGVSPVVTASQPGIDWLAATRLAKPAPGVNGRHAPTPAPGTATGVNPDSDDAALLERARRAANGAKFAALYDRGDTAGYGGDDSRADFALVSHLRFWTGADPDRMDRLFRGSALFRGKWDERRGDSTYGGRTIREVLARGGADPVYDPAAAAAQVREVSPAATITNLDERTDPDRAGKTLRVALSADEIKKQADELTGGWPKLAAGSLFVDDGGGRVFWLADAAALFAYYGRVAADGGRYSAVRWTDKAVGAVTKTEFRHHVLQTADRYEAVELYPHQPPRPGQYYASRPAAARRGGDGEAFRTLLGFFNSATDVDRDLLRAMFLTGVWGGAPGKRPAFIITAAAGPDQDKGRGVGKSTAAQLYALLFGGAISVQPDADDMASVKKRILSPDGRGMRVIVLDNVKSLKFSWADLEALITDRTVSGYQNYVGEGRVPNHFVTVLTLNGASLSKDLAQRTVTIELARPAYSGTWEAEVEAFIEANRWPILDDMVEVLRGPAASVGPLNRWGPWVSEVLARATDSPDECLAVIARRQEVQDSDGEQEDQVRESLRRALDAVGIEYRTAWVRFTSSAVTRIVRDATGKPVMTAEQSSGYLRSLQMPGWHKSDVNGRKGWAWLMPGAEKPARRVGVDFDPNPGGRGWYVVEASGAPHSGDENPPRRTD